MAGLLRNQEKLKEADELENQYVVGILALFQP